MTHPAVERADARRAVSSVWHGWPPIYAGTHVAFDRSYL